MRNEAIRRVNCLVNTHLMILDGEEHKAMRVFL